MKKGKMDVFELKEERLFCKWALGLWRGGKQKPSNGSFLCESFLLLLQYNMLIFHPFFSAFSGRRVNAKCQWSADRQYGWAMREKDLLHRNGTSLCVFLPTCCFWKWQFWDEEVMGNNENGYTHLSATLDIFKQCLSICRFRKVIWGERWQGH